jgi:hypothetical protein
VNIDLSAAHQDYREIIPPLLDELLARYPRARVSSLRVGPPRRELDVSMGYYDEDTGEIRLNAHWFARPVAVLRQAAASEPLYHGPMTDEPRHVLCHEVFHGIQHSVDGILPRMEEAWRWSTRRPRLMPADYGLSCPVEHFAELGALCDMGYGDPEQRAVLAWIIG